MFMLPCPHDIKQNGGDTSWMMLYEEAAQAGKTIVTVIHDNLWDTYYPWYRQVSEMVSLHLFTCYQSKYDSLARLPGHFVFLPTPLDVRRAGLYVGEKTGSICWMPQWKKWKGIYPFIQAMPQIEFPVDLYNAGIEYHNARHKPGAGWKNAIGLDHVGRRRGRGREDHQYWGAQLPGDLPGIYSSHDVSVDLSGSLGGQRFDGQTSCVMLEAMLYGCVSAVSTRVQLHRLSPLANQDVTWGLPNSPAGIAERLNELMANPRLRRQIAFRAIDFVQQYSDARRHAQLLLDHLENPEFGHTTEIQAPVFWDDICEDPVPEVPLVQRTEYISKYTIAATVEEPDEATTVEEDEEIISLATAPAHTLAGLGVADPRWITFISGVARAWLDAFGDQPQR